MLRWVDKGLSRLPAWRMLRSNPRVRSALGFEETLWARRIPDEQTRELVSTLSPEGLSALEISGARWADFGFASYRQTRFPEFDICRETLPERFDLIIAEHILEHVRSPAHAAANVLQMLNPGGYFLVVTPFIYKVHPNPLDCARWTQQGMRCFLEDCGFPLDAIVTSSWGNRACIAATFRNEYRLFNRYLHSVANEPDYPIVVWALATKRRT
jgi:SAM-dependent methyltransferase